MTLNARPVTDLDIAFVYNNVDDYPTLQDVADHLGKSVKTIKNRIGAMRRTGEIELISRADFDPDAVDDDDVPLSEKPQLYMEHWTAADCINLLRKMWISFVNRDGKQCDITRAHFRRYSGISESTWNRYFGTFEEFVRQAGCKLSRGARQIELNIARHASRDPMDLLNEERSRYIGKYKRDSGRRFRTAVVMSDYHDVDCDPFVRRMSIEAVKRVQPDVIFLNGDMLDLPEFGRYTVDPRTWDVIGRIKWLHEFLRDLREASPASHIIYLEGNHEFRILRHLAEATPALKTILCDLHGFNVATLLGLDQFEVEYVGKADLRAWTNRDLNREIGKNNYFLWDMLLGDHFPQGAEEGVPGWNGHHHHWKITPLYSRIYGASQWVQLPGGHVRQAEYCKGEKWNNGFMIVHADTMTKRAVFEPIDIRDFCVLGGEFYFRGEEETWHQGQEHYDQ